MTAPLNGQLLNGATSYATWAWGEGVVEATATGEAINKVYTVVTASATAEAVSSGDAQRTAFLSGDEPALADAQATATRYADMDGTAEGTASEAISVVRTAWMSESTVSAEAAIADEAQRLAYVNGETAGQAQALLNNDQAVIHRYVASNNTPLQATSWVSEDHIIRFTVRQIYFEADGIARARSRALANTTLARSVVSASAQTSAPTLLTNAIRDYQGSALAEAVAAVDSSRVRIIEGGMLCTAEAHAAPTIKTASGRYSYNSGTADAVASSSVAITVLRRPDIPAVTAEASGVDVSTYLKRRMQGAIYAVAETTANPYGNTHHFMEGTGPAEADMSVDAIAYRPSVIGSFTSEAESQGVALGLKWMECVPADAQAQAIAENSRMTWGTDDPVVTAEVAIEAYGRRGRLMTGTQEAHAWSEAEGLKDVWVEGLPKEGNASAIKFVYRVNVDTLAPDERTVLLEYSSRDVLIPESNREYVIQ